ncbi:hypothetical protein Aeqsu_1822 [Aequorivita sublithincola DSM 14238]|uniref:Uncharacterized protein n=1 Tax=Aequorivita sublithincola (strain DSM 14238 / LMG 21431 / ACAM 643 / 9-3) TaxID=746697 RepID=I3YWD3_AEQSU|nr:hypothetical protein [Aequorivita sublithincola]AFL81301.1 hypothetical protein Aeqsu_1822 [Aequorivita sublithincola DSM 14238]
MKNATKALVYNSFALVLALIALLTAWFWIYYINLFTALPSAIVAFLLCKFAERAVPNNTFTKVNYALIITAVLEGLVTLVFLLFNN